MTTGVAADGVRHAAWAGGDRGVLHRHPPWPAADRRAARRPHPPVRGDRRSVAAGVGSPSRRPRHCRRRWTPAVPGQFVVRLGFKHADPRIEDGVAALVAEGVQRVVGLVLAPHFSSMSVGEYLARAGAAARDAGVPFAGVESWATEPAYVEFLAGHVRRSLEAMPANTKVLFTAHSLPSRIIESGDPYPGELRSTAEAVARAVGLAPWAQWSVGWQSAGRTPEPWIGPDVLAVIDELGPAENADGLLVCPCGFVADHLEVLYDLDIEARRRAEGVGLVFRRTPSMNDDPAVIGALADRRSSPRETSPRRRWRDQRAGDGIVPLRARRPRACGDRAARSRRAARRQAAHDAVRRAAGRRRRAPTRSSPACPTPPTSPARSSST